MKESRNLRRRGQHARPRERRRGPGHPRQHAREAFLILVAKTAPESRRGAIVTRAEQGPTNIALVVLGARQGQRQRDGNLAIRQAPLRSGFGQLGRPGRVVGEQGARQTVGRSGLQLAELDQHARGHVRQAGHKLLCLLVFGHVEGILDGGHGRRRGTAPVRLVRLDAHPWRRHQLGIGGQRKAPVARESMPCLGFDA